MYIIHLQLNCENIIKKKAALTLFDYSVNVLFACEIKIKIEPLDKKPIMIMARILSLMQSISIS